MWRRIKQAWLAAELIYNGIARGATEITYQYHRKVDPTDSYPHVTWFHHNDNVWPRESDFRPGGYDAKCPHCGFWMLPRSDFNPRRGHTQGIGKTDAEQKPE